MLTSSINTTLGLDRHAPSLVVCAIVANGFATRTQCRYRHVYAEQEVIPVDPSLADEGAPVIHQRSGASRWSCTFNEICKRYLDPCTLGLKTILECLKHCRQRPQSHLAAVFVEHL